MEHWQSWPSQTCVGSQTFAGSRLRYISNQSDVSVGGSGLAFEFARQREQRQ
ncbi:hypothetical protein CROQUDRAFT_657519 [Cronartium quercuum f. sp. fusiforme G11]|uniref:Uncharacterized protein n=1 Tax=Cronartium quercuum f. sp. fusiforme G11 TaxID=708437 RepID=A0A9P6NMV0_9BASI|nr:hypothetical protein CROQUDRAFT_657519 [Cronartium quercuum f. sp. fusiforme G11]